MSYSHGPWETQSDYDSRPFEDFTVEDDPPDDDLEEPEVREWSSVAFETLSWLPEAPCDDDPLSDEEDLAELDKELNWWW